MIVLHFCLQCISIFFSLGGMALVGLCLWFSWREWGRVPSGAIVILGDGGCYICGYIMMLEETAKIHMKILWLIGT